jgi:hypothetical protein
MSMDCVERGKLIREDERREDSILNEMPLPRKLNQTNAAFLWSVSLAMAFLRGSDGG